MFSRAICLLTRIAQNSCGAILTFWINLSTSLAFTLSEHPKVCPSLVNNYWGKC